MSYRFLLLTSTLLCCVICASSGWAKELPPGEELVYSINLGSEPDKDTKPQNEATSEEKIIDVLKDAASPGKPPATGKPGDNPKDRQISYNKDTDAFRAHVEAPEWQRAFSDRRAFGVFARNYTNRIHCEGTISEVVYPTTKGLELEIKNKGHDLFFQVGPTVPPDITYFPVDLNIICDDEVFQVNAVVDTQYPGTNMELVLSGTVKPDSLHPYENSIQRAQALPHEEQLAKILTRVWNSDYLPYWVTKKQNRACGFGSPCKLRISVDTGISGLVAWDFLAPVTANIPELLARLGEHVNGEIIGIGRIRLKEAQRVIILSLKKAEVRQ